MYQQPIIKGRAFTLIEVFIVLVVLGVLFLLLFPMLERARSASDLTACSANLRKMIRAAHIFIQENNGQLPHYSYFNTSYRASASGILSYMEEIEPSSTIPRLHDFTTFTCPAIQRGRYPSGVAYNRTYGVNGHTYGDDSTDPDDRIGGNVAYLDDIQTPNTVMFYMDGRNQGLASSSPDRYIYGGYTRSAQWQHKHENMLHFPHNDRENVVFLDGHIETLGLDDIDRETPFSRNLWWTGGAVETRPKGKNR